ncbi:MAG: AAA family ATPase [Anaerolineales bacterium]|nr:AAA family ATPase [Anaerolineales bacterium]
MFKRIYVDNFRCLVNFELSVDSINLFLGPNGAGKSTVFDVLQKIQSLLNGITVTNLFESDDLTRWQNSPVQLFELEIEGNLGVYKYELRIKHDTLTKQARLDYESLWFDNKPLLKFEKDNVQLYDDYHLEGPNFPSTPSRSAVASIPARNNYTKLAWFIERFSRFVIVQINPMLMSENSSQEEAGLTAQAENFVSWYRHISEDQGKTFQIREALKEVIEDFDSFRFDKISDKNRVLYLRFSIGNEKRNYEYRFSELSEGQRTLIVLYTLVHYARAEDYTLCIDEPENFLALPEIQPWLTLLYDFCSDGKLQALLISHHPELIDYLALSAGCWFDRESNTPVRVKRITEDDSGLPISELVARGWLHG